MPAECAPDLAPDALGTDPVGSTESDLVAALVRVLDRALRPLGDAGQGEQACQLAAQGWALVRGRHPEQGQRLNITLHYLTRDRFARGGGAADAKAGAAREASRPRLDRPLDVRPLTPARRHELIFETYDALAANEAFVLINDHDPKPLYYQFAAERTGRFTWEPLESGPEVWRVRIAKTPGERR